MSLVVSNKLTCYPNVAAEITVDATGRVELRLDNTPASTPHVQHFSIGKMCPTRSHFTLVGFNLFSH